MTTPAPCVSPADHLRSPAMELHYATLWESIADTIPTETAVVHGDTTRTWAQYDDRAARLAAAYTAAGLGPDSKIGLYLYNGIEYLEAQYGGFKVRGVPVNVNYRYLDDELWYLLDNADAEALVFHSSLGDRVAQVTHRLPRLKLLIEVDDGGSGQVAGALSYEDVIAANEPMERIARSDDDIYMLYTGGTTGMPKGVMYDMASARRAVPALRLSVPRSTGTADRRRCRPSGSFDHRGRQSHDRHPVCAVDARHRAVAGRFRLPSHRRRGDHPDQQTPRPS